MLQNFFMICRKPIIEYDVSAPLNTSDNIVRRVYRKHTEGHMDFRIDALVLPVGMIWPSFLASKQCGSCFKNVYLQRQTTVDINRRTSSLDILRRRGKVIWAGSPGIGKSSDINFIFVELLSHLGEHDWPSMVLFRNGASLYTFTASGVTLARFIYSELEEYSLFYENTDSVLILELLESESDPVINMPFILAVSACNLMSKIKTIDQAGDHEFMLVTPPELEEVCLMAEAVMDTCPEGEVFTGLSKAEAVKEVRDRALLIGSIPRYLFGTYETFFKQLVRLKTLASEVLSHDLQELTFENIPPSAQYFVAPFFRYGVTDPCVPTSYSDAARNAIATLPEEDLNEIKSQNFLLNYEFRYLSEYAKTIHCSILREHQDILLIKSMQGFAHQLSEAIIKFGGILNESPFENIDDSFKSNNWEWHQDVGHGKILSKKSLLNTNQIPVLPRCSAEILFGGMYYEGDVRALNSNRLYRGTFHNLALYEYFTVDHTKRIIYLYQVTSEDLSDHPFAISTIDTVMTKLRLFENENLEYCVSLLCFCDWSRQETHGAKFFDTKSNKAVVTLKKLKSMRNRVAERLNVFIIRACLLPLTIKFKLP